MWGQDGGIWGIGGERIEIGMKNNIAFFLNKKEESGDRISVSGNRLKFSLETGHDFPTGLDSCAHHVIIIQ